MTEQELLDKIHSKGFDALVSGNELIIIKDGYGSSTPLNNALNLFNVIVVDGHTINLPENEVIDMILDNHMVKKEIAYGTIDNRKSITWDDIGNQLKQDNDE